MSTDNKFLQLNKDQLDEALAARLYELLAPLSEKYKMDFGHYLKLYLSGCGMCDLESMARVECEKGGLSADSVKRELAETILADATYHQITQAYDAHKAVREQSYDTARGLKNESVHEHCLTYNGSLWNHYCNLCRSQKLTEAYRCGRCDFDCCLTCAHKSH